MVDRNLDFPLLELLKSKVELQLGPNAAGIMESWKSATTSRAGGMRQAPRRGRGYALLVV
jgi:hypothetical protein